MWNTVLMNRMNLISLLRYGVGSFNFASLINGITKTFSSESQLKQVCVLPTVNIKIIDSLV